MNQKSRFAGLLRRKILILDGAMGTELYKRGLPAGVCPEAWCLAHPEAVAAIHAAYRAAGADGVYSATFGANRVKLGQYQLTDVRGTNRTLATIAKKAVGPKGLVLGDIGPTGRFVEPFGDLPFAEAVEIFREQALGLLDGGVDGFVIETMLDIQEARAALVAVREVSDLFTIVSMTYEKNGRTLNGTDPVTALVTLQELGADAVGCNCSAGPEAMLPMIEAMKPYARVPLVAKPNAGLPQLIGEETIFAMDAAAFAAFGGAFAAAGVNLMGGCCGTTPDHIAALARNLSAARPAAPARRSLAAVSSARHTVILERGNPLAIVGGRLNAAENEVLRQVVSAGEIGPVRQAIREQDKEGAALLQIRMAAPGLDEGETLARVLAQIAPTTRLPFLIDVDGVEGIDGLLRRYPGRVLIRAAGEDKNGAALLSAATRYGAVPVLICRPEAGPTLCRARIRKIVAEARKQGFTKEGIVVDLSTGGEALPSTEALRTVLDLITWCAEKVGCRTLLDLAGIGRGLPERPWLQAYVLAAAQAAGLTLAVVDPALAELKQIRAAGDLLSQAR